MLLHIATGRGIHASVGVTAIYLNTYPAGLCLISIYCAMRTGSTGRAVYLHLPQYNWSWYGYTGSLYKTRVQLSGALIYV